MQSRSAVRREEDHVRRDAYLNELYQIRESAIEEIGRAPLWKANTQWMADRVKDIRFVNTQLESMGAL